MLYAKVPWIHLIQVHIIMSQWMLGSSRVVASQRFHPCQQAERRHETILQRLGPMSNLFFIVSNVCVFKIVTLFTISANPNFCLVRLQECDNDLLIKMGPGGLPLEVFSSRWQSSPEHLRGIWPRNSLLPQQPEDVAGEKLPPVLDKLPKNGWTDYFKYTYSMLSY